MDPRAHRRFLDYLEKHEYFRRPGMEKLTRERWEELDRELADLQAVDKNAPRVKELRRALLRD